MTPERWREVGELFKAAVRIDPAGGEGWLRAACGGDDELRAEVGRLLALDERADRDRFLAPTEATGPPADRTGKAPPRVATPRWQPGPAGPAEDMRGFRRRSKISACGMMT